MKKEEIKEFFEQATNDNIAIFEKEGISEAYFIIIRIDDIGWQMAMDRGLKEHHESHFLSQFSIAGILEKAKLSLLEPQGGGGSGFMPLAALLGALSQAGSEPVNGAADIGSGEAQAPLE